jgi:hypothetical protein
MDRKDDMAHWGEVLVSKAPPDTPARPANAPVPAPNACRNPSRSADRRVLQC